jgi:hypothetical protein
MEAKISGLMLLSPVLLSGCAGQQVPPLFFGEFVTMGINVGAGPASEGLDFTLGYKDRNLAIIPVSAINTNGQTQEIVAWNQEGDRKNFRDALSVFGQFKSQGEETSNADQAKPKRRIALGRFFATGLAASSISAGYQKGWTDPPTGNTSQPGNSSQPVIERTAAGPTTQQIDSNPQTQSQAFAPPLIFAQSNTVGIGFTTAVVADQGANFTLGYTGRDIAFVPVMARNADGTLTRLGGRNQVGPDGKVTQRPQDAVETDALSVLGQFEVDTATASIDFGLNRFFTTGMAARNLAEGFKAAIARELQAQESAAAGGQ